MSLYSTASAFAKDTWLDVYADQLGRAEGSLLQLFGLNTDARVKVEGRRWYMKIKAGDDLGFGMMAQGGDFPTPGDTTSNEATLELKRFADTINFDAHEMELLDSLDAAAAPIMAEKMSSSRARVLRELERQAIMDGSGKLMKIASISTVTPTFDVAGNEYAERNPYTWVDDPNRSRYRIVDPTDGTDQKSSPASFTFSAINESANTATASVTLAGGAAGDYIVTDYGQTGFTSGGVYTSPEFTGLLGMIDDSNTYLGLSRSSYPYWKSTVISNSGTLRDLTENLTLELINKTARRSSNGQVIPSDYVALADPGVWSAYHQLISSGLRYSISDNPDIGWGGREYLSMHGVPLYKHIGAPRHQILLVNKNKVKFVGPKHDHSSIVKFHELNGSMFFQATASSGQGYADSVYAMITGWIGMYTERPRDHARLDDLNLIAPAYTGQ